MTNITEYEGFTNAIKNWLKVMVFKINRKNKLFETWRELPKIAIYIISNSQ